MLLDCQCDAKIDLNINVGYSDLYFMVLLIVSWMNVTH